MKTDKKIIKIIKKESKDLYLGVRSSFAYINDPQRLGFSLSRYKFVAKMFEGFSEVLEVGAGDGFKSLVVKQHCKNLLLTDILDENLESFKKLGFKNIKYVKHNFIKNSTKKKFDGIYSLDVLEHIKKRHEKLFLKNICKSLNKNGSLIIGMPSIESQKYASRFSKMGHINCKSKNELKNLLKNFFHHVFMFSMNDEVLHTGYDKMSHYIFALASTKK